MGTSISRKYLHSHTIITEKILDRDYSGMDLSNYVFERCVITGAAKFNDVNLSYAYFGLCKFSAYGKCFNDTTIMNNVEFDTCQMSGNTIISGNYSSDDALIRVRSCCCTVNNFALNLAERIKFPSFCPEEGMFTAWKQCGAFSNGEYKEVLVKLIIPEDAKRVSYYGTSRKCRASEAIVEGIYDLKGKKLRRITATSWRDHKFVYKVGETVVPDSFDPNPLNECTHGIHFFMEKERAIKY